jgi:hypothetical protein
MKSVVRRSPGCACFFDRLTIALDPGEITPERFEREFFGVDLAPGAHSFAPEKRYRHAPSLKSVLKKKRENKARQHEEFLIHKTPEQSPAKREKGGVYLQPALDVPLFVEIGNQARENRRRRACRPLQPTPRPLIYLVIDGSRCLSADPVGGFHFGHVSLPIAVRTQIRLINVSGPGKSSLAFGTARR